MDRRQLDIRPDVWRLPMARFSFTPEQVENLKSWKNSLSTEKARTWAQQEEEAEVTTSRILNDAAFKGGENLSAETLDTLFSNMRSFSNNRNLSNLLYKTNELSEFNAKLRNLVHGTRPFPERVDGFFKLKSIGVQTLSQFLIAADSRKYPLVTSQTKEVLNISSEQDEAALEDALELFQVRNRGDLLDRTLDYLRDSVIFKAAKDLLALEKYTAVNNLIWFEFAAEEEGPATIYTSLSMEDDLRDFLAKDVGLIEKGLKLIGKEYQCKESDGTRIGDIDLLCRDRKGTRVVVELKKGRKSDEVVGQTLRYLGWVGKNLKTKTRGVVIVNEPDEKLDYALLPVKNLISLKYYRVNFEISDRFES